MKGMVVSLTEQEAQRFVRELRPDTPGAYPAGTKIRKIHADDTDLHKDGDTGVVVESLDLREDNLFGYMVLWDDRIPDIPVFIVSKRIEAIENG